MKKTVLAVIDQDPVLSELCGILTARQKATMERLKFLQKQIKDVLSDRASADEVEWKRIEHHLRERGLLKDELKNNEHLEQKQNAIYRCAHDGSDGVFSFLNMLGFAPDDDSA